MSAKAAEPKLTIVEGTVKLGSKTLGKIDGRVFRTYRKPEDILRIYNAVGYNHTLIGILKKCCDRIHTTVGKKEYETTFDVVEENGFIRRFNGYEPQVFVPLQKMKALYNQLDKD